MFRDQCEVIVLDADRERFGNVNVIELLRRFCALFQLLEFRWLDCRDRNQLELDRFLRAGVDRLVINRRAGPAYLIGRVIFARADAVMLKECGVFHTGDSPIGTILTIGTVDELRETFLRDSNPPMPILVTLQTSHKCAISRSRFCSILWKRRRGRTSLS